MRRQGAFDELLRRVHVLPSHKVTPWLKVLKSLVAYRLIAPGSGWELHGQWLDPSAMADLRDETFRLAAQDILYRCHDRRLRSVHLQLGRRIKHTSLSVS